MVESTKFTIPRFKAHRLFIQETGTFVVLQAYPIQKNDFILINFFMIILEIFLATLIVDVDEPVRAGSKQRHHGSQEAPSPRQNRNDRENAIETRSRLSRRRLTTVAVTS